MSPRLPNIAAKDARRAFERSGCIFIGQRGSHVKLRGVNGVIIVIPMHDGDIKRPLLKAAIKQSGLSEEEFRALL